MITIRQIKTADTAYYSFQEELLVNSFPKEERRELALQREFTDSNPLFVNNILLDNDEPIGIISYWDFNGFIYAEHFAIHPSKRNGGYGQETLELLKRNLQRPLVLEVDLPQSEASKRRIQFYQRQGFLLWWGKEYLQPPYRKGDNYLPMRLMVSGDLKPERDFERIKSTIYKHVYFEA